MIMILSVDVRIFIVSMDSSASASLMFNGLHRYFYRVSEAKNRIIELRLFEWELKKTNFISDFVVFDNELN